MENTKENLEITQVKNSINQLRQSLKYLALADHHLENNNPEIACVILNRVLTQLRDLQKNSKDINFQEKLDIQVEIKELLHNTDIGFFINNKEKIKKTIVDLENSLRETIKDLRLNHNMEHPVVSEVKKISKGLGMFLAGSLGIYFLAFSWIQFSQKTHGIEGQYFNGKNFETHVVTRWDPEINFTWGRNAPTKKMKANKFSVRWTGKIKTPVEGVYEFITDSDDGIRLWINKKLMIDNWTKHKLARNRNHIKLSQGLHQIKLEYFEHRKNATIILSWKRPNTSDIEPIPSKFYVPSK